MMIQQNDQEHALRKYLETQYEGIFDEISINAHIRDYVGYVFSDSVVPLVARQVPQGSKVLDIGCGFGAFVISARRIGLEAVGVEIAPFEVEYAKRRLEQEMPELDPSSVYFLGDGHTLPFDDLSFDAVTLWNVLEHVPDSERLLSEVSRVLKPNGTVFIICPNYAAFRMEAHYIVPWWPMLPKKLGAIYLRLRGRDPRFLETSVFYRTNWEVQRVLKSLGMKVARIDGPHPFDASGIDLFVKSVKEKILMPAKFNNPRIRLIMKLLKRIHLNWIMVPAANILALPLYSRLWWNRTIYNKDLYNPIVDSVILSATKAERNV
jgi:ubiquinone/menaquinone biosynthesis C-methylase UbiE